ncbi:MAG: ATP-dependent DNA ligase [Bacteroidota bacterium]|nr:ATP-dependent DNA ligase [Bacteroidota bacterium]
MKAFAHLFYELDQTNKTNEKVEVLVNYLKIAPDEDKLWMLSLFTGRRPRRIVNSTRIREWAAEFAGIPQWLFDECYTIVGDLSETISLLLPPPTRESNETLTYWIHYMEALAPKNEDERKEAIFAAWNSLTQQERFVFSKLTSSTFRVGVSQSLVIRALSKHSGVPVAVLTHRMMGKWHPNKASYAALTGDDSNNEDVSRPYPFYLAHAIESDPSVLGNPSDWSAEWKWDGIRAQLIKRKGELFIWSRGEDLITDRFPEFQLLKSKLPDGCVLDGELLPYAEGKVLSFNILQTRIGRKNLTAKSLKEAPVVLFAYDLLEWEGNDIRERPLAERQSLLHNLINDYRLSPLVQVSPAVEFNDWKDLATQRLLSREHSAEGLMLKRKASPYLAGRKRGDWWKWKIDPLSIDAVLIYANRGTGRRANLYTDYTFAVWNQGQLISFAKAYSGLTDKEIDELDKWIRQNTVQKFGPVRTVKPHHVFEIGFEGIQASGRHKSGVAVRFPRILRWRRDKPVEEADTMAHLRSILKQYESSGGEESGE